MLALLGSGCGSGPPVDRDAVATTHASRSQAATTSRANARSVTTSPQRTTRTSPEHRRRPATTRPQRGGSSPLVATLTAPTHAPKAGEPWAYTIRATHRAGKPIEGTATVTVVAAAGQVIDGVGIFDAKRVIEQTYRWPRVDRGRALVFQVEISALESTKIVRYPVRVQ